MPKTKVRTSVNSIIHNTHKYSEGEMKSAGRKVTGFLGNSAIISEVGKFIKVSWKAQFTFKMLQLEHESQTKKIWISAATPAICRNQDIYTSTLASTRTPNGTIFCLLFIFICWSLPTFKHQVMAYAYIYTFLLKFYH